MIANGDEVSFCGDENVLELDRAELSKMTELPTLKRVNAMICKLHLHKAIILKRDISIL